MIRFGEDRRSDYSSRTKINVVMSDITIAFAVDEATGGERATKKFAEESATPFFSFRINENGRIPGTEKEKMDEFIATAKGKISKMNRGLILNIAGNGMTTLSKHGITQERADELVFNFLSNLKAQGLIFHSVRSGGQTGFDESALKAADKLGIMAFCLAPQGWKFRDATGTDISNEALFKRRFIL